MTAELHGPVEDNPWPTVLTGHVVSGARIHGIDARRDLARHYSFAELVLLTLTGEPPTREHGRAFELALTWLAPTGVAEAPAHAAVLARLCSASSTGVLGSGAIVLIEQARGFVDQHAALLAWLEAPSGEPPCAPHAEDDDGALLRDQLRSVAPGMSIAAELPVDAALVAVLHACGVRSPERLMSAVVVARFACVVAEGLAAAPRDFSSYPMNVPAYAYRDPPLGEDRR